MLCACKHALACEADRQVLTHAGSLWSALPPAARIHGNNREDRNDELLLRLHQVAFVYITTYYCSHRGFHDILYCMLTHICGDASVVVRRTL